MNVACTPPSKVTVWGALLGDLKRALGLVDRGVIDVAPTMSGCPPR